MSAGRLFVTGTRGCRFAGLALLCVLAPVTAQAGMREILDAVRTSEFRFVRSTSEVPFMPLGWVQERYYSDADFEDPDGVLPSASASESTFGLGGVVPPYVGARDMLLVGGDLTWDRVDVKSGPINDQSVLRITPVLGWLHQFENDEMLGAFVAPTLSKELESDGPWGGSGYAGVIGMHWFSDRFQVLYGGVYQYSFGRHSGYPYAGLQWTPTPRLSLSLVIPWPTLTYAPTDDWILQLGMSPGGSSWVGHGSGFEATESISSWTLNVGAGRRLKDHLWLYGGVGVAGLRGLELEGDHGEARLDGRPAPAFTLALQFRP